MKVVVNSRFLTQRLTGVQRFAIEISKALKKKYGDEIVFVSPKGILHNEEAQELQVVTMGKRKGHLWEQLDLPTYLKGEGSPLLLNLANTGPIRYRNKICTIHDVAFLTYPETFSKKFVLAYKFLIPLLIRTSLRLITVSSFSKSELIGFYQIPEAKIEVVYNAVDGSFKPVKDMSLSSIKYFVAVSSLNHRKNLLSTLKAFVTFHEVNGDFHLYIIGDFKSDSFKDVDLSKYAAHPNIVFCGRVADDDLVRYYSNAVGFLFPSFYEGFGIPPLEAQACDCPVVVSDVSSLPEIFEDSALYCSPHSVDSITKAMQRLVMEPDLSLKLISKGRANLNRYSWGQSADKIVDIIKQIAYEKSNNT